jgi:hypothetical protein
MTRTTTAIPATTQSTSATTSHHNQYGCHQDGYCYSYCMTRTLPFLQRWCSRETWPPACVLLAEVACVWRIYCPR